MIESPYALFPLPTSFKGEHSNGSIINWAPTCQRCTQRYCESDNRSNLCACPYGVNFVRLSKDLLVGGFIVTDEKNPTSAQIKRRRTDKVSGVTSKFVERCLGHFDSFNQNIQESFQAIASQQQEEYLSSHSGREELLRELTPYVQGTLNQSHDFLALLKQVKSNIEAILEERFPGVKPEESAEHLLSEGAIFFACELMLNKVDATAVLLEPNLMHGRESDFHLHPFILKYVHIYRSYAKQRGVDLKVVGECHARVRYNDAALGTAIHSILDNLVKYAPPGSSATVLIVPGHGRWELRFHSLGPKVLTSEANRIFSIGYRGEAAQKVGAAGLGFGLAAAMAVSDALDLELSFAQVAEEHPLHPSYFSTTFSLKITETVA